VPCASLCLALLQRRGEQAPWLKKRLLLNFHYERRAVSVLYSAITRNAFENAPVDVLPVLHTELS